MMALLLQDLYHPSWCFLDRAWGTVHSSHISRLKDTLDMVAVIQIESQSHVETTDHLIVTGIYLILVRKHHEEDPSLS